MSHTKTSALIDSCTATFKRTGLLRLAEEPSAASRIGSSTVTVAQTFDNGRSYSVLPSSPSAPLFTPQSFTATDSSSSWGFQNTAAQSSAVFRGNAALDVALQEPSSSSQNERSALDGRDTNQGRAVGLSAVDDFLPDGGLPTGRVTELVMSGGAAWGTRLALWACRAAQAQAALTGTECWCAYVDPSGSLHAQGALATGVTLSRLLVLRPTLEDVERVVLRLSEARVFSVIVVDLVGVPWAIRTARSSHRAATPWSGWSAGGRKRGGKLGLNPEHRRQNWPRTVRQLALRLANTQAQVILLTEGQVDEKGKMNSQTQHGLPLPVALRLQMSSTRSGVSLHVVKEAQGRVGGQVTVPWAVWWGKEAAQVEASSVSRLTSREGRAKPLGVQPERMQSLLRTASPERPTRDPGLPVVVSSRMARSSRASL